MHVAYACLFAPCVTPTIMAPDTPINAHDVCSIRVKLAEGAADVDPGSRLGDVNADISGVLAAATVMGHSTNPLVPAVSMMRPMLLKNAIGVRFFFGLPAGGSSSEMMVAYAPIPGAAMSPASSFVIGSMMK